MPDINLILLTLRVFAIVSILTSYIFSYSYIHLISYNNEYHNSPFTASDCTISFVTCPDLEGGGSQRLTPIRWWKYQQEGPAGCGLTHEPLGEGDIKLPPLRFVEYIRNRMIYERETWP